jgi:hypothetical protein
LRSSSTVSGNHVRSGSPAGILHLILTGGVPGGTVPRLRLRWAGPLSANPTFAP